MVRGIGILRGREKAMKSDVRGSCTCLQGQSPLGGGRGGLTTSTQQHMVVSSNYMTMYTPTMIHLTPFPRSTCAEGPGTRSLFDERGKRLGTIIAPRHEPIWGMNAPTVYLTR